jgi:hypothetical protein
MESNNNTNYGQGQQPPRKRKLESLSREDLVKLVRKLLVEKNEAQETAKKEVEVSSRLFRIFN